MRRRMLGTAAERRLAEILQAEPAIWTPQCLEPEDLLELAERGASHPDAARGVAHLAECAYCRREYRVVRETLGQAARNRKNRNNNLPRPATSFIGRARELAQIKDGMERGRLLTLTGPGGCGKTRLALEVAAQTRHKYKDGAWLVSLTDLSNPALVPQAVASVFELAEQVGRSLTDTLADYLAPKRLLLILDNCEELISACASLAARLLGACPHLRILATSRQEIGIGEETAYRVPMLSLPDPESPHLMESEAVQLFIQRASDNNRGFALTERNAPAVARICRRVEGNALALGVTAQVREYPETQVAQGLETHFRSLPGGTATLSVERTLEETLNWRFTLLSERERTLLRRLSVFRGGCTRDAAQAVCTGGILDAEIVERVLAELAGKELLNLERRADQTRYRMDDTLRQHHQKQLKETGEERGLRDRHLDFFMHYVEEAGKKLSGGEQALATERLNAEYGNVQAAFVWCDILEDEGPS